MVKQTFNNDFSFPVHECYKLCGEMANLRKAELFVENGMMIAYGSLTVRMICRVFCLNLWRVLICMIKIGGKIYSK